MVPGLAVLLSCSTPASRIRDFADDAGYHSDVIRADGFDHQVFTRGLDAGPLTGEQQTLHIYLEGDGQPWRHRTITMLDPTSPETPLMLRLMGLDQAPAAYIGRPCYNGFARAPGCHLALWTSGRFSTTVVESMARVIQTLYQRHAPADVWLIGHSGGGALAMLLAARLPSVSQVVTLAGNLDTDAWTAHHGYTRLFGSLNPARQPALRDSVTQWHLLGVEDRVIPPRLVEDFVRRQPAAIGIRLAGFTHSCCWASLWPGVLKSVSDAEPGQLPGEVFWRGSRVASGLSDAAARSASGPSEGSVEAAR